MPANKENPFNKPRSGINYGMMLGGSFGFGSSLYFTLVMHLTEKAFVCFMLPLFLGYGKSDLVSDLSRPMPTITPILPKLLLYTSVGTVLGGLTGLSIEAGIHFFKQPIKSNPPNSNDENLNIKPSYSGS